MWQELPANKNKIIRIWVRGYGYIFIFFFIFFRSVCHELALEYAHTGEGKNEMGTREDEKYKQQFL